MVNNGISKIMCECGCEVIKNSMPRHKKSEYHIMYRNADIGETFYYYISSRGCRKMTLNDKYDLDRTQYFITKT